MDDNPTVGFGTVGGSIIRNIAQHYIQRNEAEKALPFRTRTPNGSKK